MDKRERFWIEKRPVDFPIYRDEKTGMREVIILAIGGAIALLWALHPFGKGSAYYLLINMSVIFLGTLIPYLIARIGKSGHLFQKPRAYDIVLVILFAIGEFYITLMIVRSLNSFGIVDSSTVGSNPILDLERDWKLFTAIVFQIFGEEMFRIDIFLAVLCFFSRFKQKRKQGIILGIIVSSLVFGLAHLGAYGNLIQCLCVQGTSGLLYTYLYIRTKNIAVPYAAHLLKNLALIYVIVPGTREAAAAAPLLLLM